MVGGILVCGQNWNAALSFAGRSRVACCMTFFMLIMIDGTYLFCKDDRILSLIWESMKNECDLLALPVIVTIIENESFHQSLVQ